MVQSYAQREFSKLAQDTLVSRQRRMPGVLSLDDVGPPGEPHLRITWLPPLVGSDAEPVDLTDVAGDRALLIVLSAPEV